MKIFLLLSLILTALFSDQFILSPEEKEWIKKNKTITFTGDPNWLPFEAFDKRGNYIGIVSDHLKLIEKETGLNFAPLRVKSWSESLQTAREGRVSIISGDATDKTLNQNFKPINPYLINPIIIIMDHKANYVEDLNTLKKQKIAIIKDYGYTADLFTHYPDLKFQEVENVQEGLLGVSEGRFDAMLASSSLARYSISQMGLDDIKIVGKTSVVMEVTLFVDKKLPLLHNIINRAMKNISTAQQENIINEWASKEPLSSLENMLSWSVALVVTLALLILIYIAKHLHKSETRYSYALEGSNDALWNWDIQSNSVYFSPRFQEILGCSEKDFNRASAGWTDRVHPDEKQTVLDLIEKNLKGETEVFELEYRIEHKNGSWVWIHNRAKTVYNSEGQPLRMDGICRDITREKNLSIELNRSRHLLSSIIDNIPVRIFWKDTLGVYQGYNKLFADDIMQCADCDNFHRDDFIGKTDHDMPWKKEALGYVKDDKEVIFSATPKLNYEEQQTRSDGQKAWLSTSKVPLFDERGEVYGVLGAYYDITAVKEHQEENERNTRRLESVQELGHLGSWEWNMATGELVWSDEVYRIFGEEPQSFPATYEAFKSYIPQEYQIGLEEAIDQAMKNREHYEYDHEIRRKDGSTRLVREAGYIRFNDEGEPVSMLGTVLDINSILEAKSTLRENEELTDLLKKFDENVIASNTDLKGIITYASQAFTKISGYSKEELMGEPQNIVRHPDMPKEIFKDLWETIQLGKTWHGEIKNRKKDGTSYWVESTISPIFNANKDIVGYSSIRRDITHEKQVEDLHHSLERKSAELLDLNKGLEKRIRDAVQQSKQKDHLMAQQSKLASMGEMIGNIAHQWRQPLNALGLLLQKQQIFFERGMLTSEKINESIEKGTSLINKMSTTIDDFRDFFKPNKEMVNFNIKEAIDDTLELINAALYNQNISLVLNLEEGQSLYGYKNEFSQVLLNLINNAKDVLIESEKKNAEIRISCTCQDGKILVTIADNGGGIDKDVIEHIFEPYFTTKDEGKGTGIGLYMSKMIIEENMNGKLSVQNDEEGAVFRIEL